MGLVEGIRIPECSQEPANSKPRTKMNPPKACFLTLLGASLVALHWSLRRGCGGATTERPPPFVPNTSMRACRRGRVAASEIRSPNSPKQQHGDRAPARGPGSVFEKAETVESGLWPIFNNTSCAICHSAPALGGSSAALDTRFGRDEAGHFDPLTALGGSLLQKQAIDPGTLEKIPDEATIVIQRQAMPLFGAGLIEAIPDDTLQALAQRRKADGILGRVALVQDVTTGQMRVGRFGWKAQQATLLGMAAVEYRDEMGITNRFYPDENAPNGDFEKLAAFDHIADPEDGGGSSSGSTSILGLNAGTASGKADADRVTDFMRFLAPPATPRPTADVQTGLGVFNKIGCAECHVPALYTGTSK